jgi:hypothetical protein
MENIELKYKKQSLREVYSWLRSRCNYTKNLNYKNYWWRWIKCEWTSFSEFYNDMNEWYKKWLSIDRINVNWNYSKNNCRWATMKEQARNRRNNILVNWITLVEYCENKKLKYYTIYRRITKEWFSIDEAIAKPIRTWNRTKFLINN